RLSTLASRANTAHDLALITCLQLTLYTALDRLDQGIEICLCSASVENAGLGVELTHCCLRKEQWYEQTRTAALQCPRESQNSPAPFAGRQSGVGFVRTAPDHSQPV